MFEISKFNMDKFVHTFIQNLGLRIESHACNKFSKITFITHIHKSSEIKQLLLYSVEKAKENNMQQNLDLSNEKSIQYFLEKHANLFDKFTYSSNTRILTSHLNNINTKILQKMKIRKKYNEAIKEEVRVHNKALTYNKKLRTNKLNGLNKNSLSAMVCKENCISFYNYKKNKLKKGKSFGNSKLPYHDVIIPDNHRNDSILKTDNDEQKAFVRYNLVKNSIINIAKQEIEMTEKFLWLYMKDIEYVKRNIQVTLHIAKSSKYNHDARKQIEYYQVLCHHAILCLIEPSKKGIVLIEDDLLSIIQKYLLSGYKYHFEFQRGSKDCYTALLILSRWAKVLVKHMNTTMMHTICGILGCDVQKIAVLYNPEGK